MELKSVFVAPDGTIFESRAEAADYLRKPKIKEAFLGLTASNEELAEWFVSEEATKTIALAFGTEASKRVSKADKKKLQAGLDLVVALFNAETPEARAELIENGCDSLSFLAEHANAVVESFKYAVVARTSEDEKIRIARTTLMAGTDNNEDLVDWIVENRDAVLKAYNAGKANPNPKGAEALAAWRAKQAAEKEAKVAAAAE